MFFDNAKKARSNAERRLEEALAKLEEIRGRHAEAQAARTTAAAALREAQEQLAEADDPIPALRAARTALADAEDLVRLRGAAVARAKDAAQEAEASFVEERQAEAVEAYRAAAQDLAEALEQASCVSERLREIQAGAPRPSDLPELHWRELRPEGETRLTWWRSELRRFIDAPARPKPEGVLIRFLHAYHEGAVGEGPGYGAGDRAHLPRDLAQRLVAEGVAERL